MSTQQPASGDVSNEKLLSALTYPIPIVGVVILFSDSMKNNPVMRMHAVQSLALDVVLVVAEFIVSFILGLTPLVCLVPIISLVIWFAPTIYFAIQAYNEKSFTIPVVTDFCKKQNWF